MADQVKIKTAHGESIVDVPAEGSFQRAQWDQLLAEDKLEILGTVKADGTVTSKKTPAKKTTRATKKAPAKPAAAAPADIVADPPE